MQNCIDGIALERFASGKVRELDHKAAIHNRTAGFFAQFGAGEGRAAGGKQIVDNCDALAGLDMATWILNLKTK